MKKMFLAVAILSIIILSSCTTVQPVAQTQATQNPFGQTFKLPCAEYDTKTEFAATGIYRGSMNQKGQLQMYALQNAQQIVRMKAKHAYKGMVSDYSSSLGNNQGNDIESKIQMAGDQMIDVILNDTEATCIEFGAVQADGHIECYVGIRVSKQEIAEKVSKTVANKLSEEEKMRIGFNEEQYREKMEQRMQQYEEKNK